MGPYGINSLRNDILPEYSANLGSNNLIVENIMMSDVRNDTEHRCVIVLQGTSTIQRESDPILLLVAGECHYRVHYHIYIHIFIATCCNDLMHT